MRNVFSPQLSFGQKEISDIQIDLSSRDDIPIILLGLQHIYTTESLKKTVFEILNEIAPKKTDSEGNLRVVSIEKGRPGMDQWAILVLGCLRLGLNTDFDRILELANQHKTLREMLGLGSLDTDKRYCLQTLKDNLKLFTPMLMERINSEVIRAGYQLLDVDIHEMIRGRCDSFVLKTDVHFPTDINLLYDALRVLIGECVQWNKHYAIQGWRQHQYNLKKLKSLYRNLQKLKHSSSKKDEVKQAKALEIIKAHQVYTDLATLYLDRIKCNLSTLKNKFKVQNVNNNQKLSHSNN